jgi:DNA ligase (NAD+)
VGAQAAQLLARRFGTLDALRSASLDEITAVRGIGDVIARSVRAFFDDPTSQALVERLRAHGPAFRRARGAAGQRHARRRDGGDHGHATHAVAQRRHGAGGAGGRAGDRLGVEENHVRGGGRGGGSKLEKAEALGVEVIDEAELQRRVAG